MSSRCNMIAVGWWVINLDYKHSKPSRTTFSDYSVLLVACYQIPVAFLIRCTTKAENGEFRWISHGYGARTSCPKVPKVLNIAEASHICWLVDHHFLTKAPCRSHPGAHLLGWGFVLSVSMLIFWNPHRVWMVLDLRWFMMILDRHPGTDVFWMRRALLHPHRFQHLGSTSFNVIQHRLNWPEQKDFSPKRSQCPQFDHITFRKN